MRRVGLICCWIILMKFLMIVCVLKFIVVVCVVLIR